MSELPHRVERAFRDHGAFEHVDGAVYEHVGTAFDGRVTAAVDGDGGRTGFAVEIRAPTLSAATADDVAPVVEEGWFETFELRVEDVGSVTRAERDPSPSVSMLAEEVVVEFEIDDIDPGRGVDDAAALIEYVEGTYVQGIVPGYDYVDPVASLVSRAQQAAGSDGV